MSCIVLAELLALLIFIFWPVPGRENTYQDIVFSESEAIIDEVIITTQKSSPPPPPRPQVPIPVPNDEVIEEEILTLEDIDISEYTDSMTVGMGRVGDSDQVASNPQMPPSVIRIVEPTVPEAAKKADIKAEILVSFLVNKEGQVEEATIAQIKLFNKDSETYEMVDHIDYGLTNATLEAALQWKFRPARDGGSVVKSYTKHIFTYGF